MKIIEYVYHVEVEPETRQEYAELAKQHPELQGFKKVCIAKLHAQKLCDTLRVGGVTATKISRSE